MTPLCHDTTGPDLPLAEHPCECCRIALAPGRDGVLRALWRQVFEPQVRDHALAALLPSGPGPLVRATLDDWQIDACPHHGPGLAPAADAGFHAVWFGSRQQDGRAVTAVRYGRLQPDGQPQPDTVQVLPDAHAEHADVQAWGERVAVVWRSVAGQRSTLKAWLSRDNGQTFRLQVLGTVTGDNDQPRLAQSCTKAAMA